MQTDKFPSWLQWLISLVNEYVGYSKAAALMAIEANFAITERFAVPNYYYLLLVREKPDEQWQPIQQLKDHLYKTGRMQDSFP